MSISIVSAMTDYTYEELYNDRTNEYFLEGKMDVSSVEDIYKAISPGSATIDNYDHDIHFLPHFKRVDYPELTNLPLSNVKIQTRVGGLQDGADMRELR